MERVAPDSYMGEERTKVWDTCELQPRPEGQKTDTRMYVRLPLFQANAWLCIRPPTPPVYTEHLLHVQANGTKNCTW